MPGWDYPDQPIATFFRIRDRTGRYPSSGDSGGRLWGSSVGCDFVRSRLPPSHNPR